MTEKATTFRDVRRQMHPIISRLLKEHSKEGAFDWAVIVPDVARHLRDTVADDDGMALEVFSALGHYLVHAHTESASPPMPKGPGGQIEMWYEPDALLHLGGREVVRMADTRADDLRRYEKVIEANFAAQSAAYEARMAYINDRLPRLLASGMTLAEIESSLAMGDAA